MPFKALYQPQIDLFKYENKFLLRLIMLLYWKYNLKSTLLTLFRFGAYVQQHAIISLSIIYQIYFIFGKKSVTIHKQTKFSYFSSIKVGLHEIQRNCICLNEPWVNKSHFEFWYSSTNGSSIEERTLQPTESSVSLFSLTDVLKINQFFKISMQSKKKLDRRDHFFYDLSEYCSNNYFCLYKIGKNNNNSHH